MSCIQESMFNRQWLYLGWSGDDKILLAHQTRFRAPENGADSSDSGGIKHAGDTLMHSNSIPAHLHHEITTNASSQTSPGSAFSIAAIAIYLFPEIAAAEKSAAEISR